ncbi:hypothetical protein RFI_15665, partial [Reticulomyxa filosa]
EMEQLKMDNKSLQEEVLHFGSILKEKGLFRAYRPGTITNWDVKDLEAMESEMVKQRAQMQKEDLKRQFERQEQMYWQSQGAAIPEDAEQDQAQAQAQAQAQERDEDAATHTQLQLQAQSPSQSQYPSQSQSQSQTQPQLESKDDDNKSGGAHRSHLVRSQTRTISWNETEFQAAKNEIMAQLKKLKDEQIAEMVEKQDALRMQRFDDPAKPSTQVHGERP